MPAKKEKEFSEVPKGCMEATSPGGDRIIVRQPRGPGPWFRVKHKMFGAELLKAKTAEEAVKKFFDQYAPAESQNAEWFKEAAKQCRIAKLPEPKPAE